MRHQTIEQVKKQLEAFTGRSDVTEVAQKLEAAVYKVSNGQINDYIMKISQRLDRGGPPPLYPAGGRAGMQQQQQQQQRRPQYAPQPPAQQHLAPQALGGSDSGMGDDLFAEMAQGLILGPQAGTPAGDPFRLPQAYPPQGQQQMPSNTANHNAYQSQAQPMTMGHAGMAPPQSQPQSHAQAQAQYHQMVAEGYRGGAGVRLTVGGAGMPVSGAQLPAGGRGAPAQNLAGAPVPAQDVTEAYWALLERMRREYLADLEAAYEVFLAAKAQHAPGSPALGHVDKLGGIRPILPRLQIRREQAEQAGRRLSAGDLAALYALDAQLKPYVAKLRASMVHPSNKRRHLDPAVAAAARAPASSQQSAYAPTEVEASRAASPATTVGAPTPPTVATPPPAVKVEPEGRIDMGAHLVGLLERAPAAMASAAAVLAARVLQRSVAKTPPWPEALRVESPPVLPTLPIQSRCVFTSTAGGAGAFSEDMAFSPVSVLDWPPQSGASQLLCRASSDAAALQALRERLEAEGRQVGERLGVACQISECPVYSDALLVHLAAASAASGAAAAAGTGASNNGGPALDGSAEHKEWTALSLRFTQRCFSDGESPAPLFHQRCDGTDCPQADALRSVFEAAISATALPLSLEVIAETWLKSLTLRTSGKLRGTMQRTMMLAAFLAIVSMACVADARSLQQTDASAPAPAVSSAAAAPAAAPEPTVRSTSVRAARAATTPAPAAPAPAPPPANGCVMQYLQSHGEYSTLLRLIYASNSNISQTLSDSTSGITMFAPDNDGINQTLSDLGLKLEGLLQDPKLVLSILQFHVLPSPVEYRALRDGYSFNTALPVDQDQDPVRVDRQAETVQLSGANTNAGLKDRGTHICMDVVYKIDGLLLPKGAIRSS
ncbi:hypothetical protein WJX81_001744 [Elliptochloris bilobata]|uniref:FAS1 domain-containing protein n=1 Tax=Elliptochloris bilobata TaxID=381761 RepID=A0AAW1QYT6_9CHLO